MSIPQIVIVENEFLSLIPGKAAPEVTTVPLVRLRDIPAFLRRSSCLHSLSSLLDQNRNSRNENRPIIQMKEGVLQDLTERQSLRTGHGSFCIPGCAPAQIIATGKEHTYLIRREDTCVQISYTSGYWTSDFCGVGGFQQVLWLPNINMNLEEWTYRLAERILAQVLRQSALTDGVDTYLSKCVRIEQCSTPFVDACPHIILCRVSEIADSNEEPMELSTAENESDRQSVTTSGGKQSAWRKTMSRELESRLIQKRKEHDKGILTQQVKRLLLKRNREALQDLVNPEGTSLQVARIRYRTLSRGKGSVVILLEVDVAAVGESPAISGLHLSCSPMSTNGDNVSVRTQSGIVPELVKGMCVTIMMIVEIDGIVFSNNYRQYPLHLNIEAHCNLTTRRALNLTTLDLPMELLLSTPRTMATVEYLTDLVPSAAYECRKPLRLVVDVSYCFPCDWKVWVEEFNGLLKGSGHRLDLCDGDESMDTLSLLLFACPKEEVPGLVALMRHRLPELAKVINAVDHQ